MNSKNTFTGSISDKRTIPYNVTKSGKINTIGINVEGLAEVTYDNLVGAFTVGAIVTGGTSGATGTIVSDSGTVLVIDDFDGVFVNNEGLTDSATAVTADVNGTPEYPAFTTECSVGDWVYDSAQDEVRQITNIFTDKIMYLREAFSSDLTEDALEVSPCSPRPKEISVLIPNGSADGEIDGVAWSAGIGWSSNKTGQYNNSRMGGHIDPIIVDANGTTMLVQINY